MTPMGLLFVVAGRMECVHAEHVAISFVAVLLGTALARLASLA